jgi:hypothetical protein
MFDDRLFDFVDPYLTPDQGGLGPSQGTIVATSKKRKGGYNVEWLFNNIKHRSQQPSISTSDAENAVHGWGMLLFIHKQSYLPIPKELKIYHGDTWLWQANRRLGKKPQLIDNINIVTYHWTTSNENNPDPRIQQTRAKDLNNGLGIVNLYLNNGMFHTAS